MSTYIPVQPYIDSNARLDSIRRILGDASDSYPHTYPAMEAGKKGLSLKDLKALLPKNVDIQNDTMGMEGKWSLSRMSASVAAQLGYGGVFTSTNEAFGDILVADSMAGYRCVKTKTGAGDNSNDVVFGTIWGYSIRLIVKVWGYNSNSQLTLPFVASQVSVDQMSAEYSVEGIGGTLKTFATVLRALPKLGRFDNETFYSLTNAAKLVLQELLVSHTDDTVLLPIQVGVNMIALPQNTLVGAKSVRFGMLCIRNKICLSEALAYGEENGLFTSDAPTFSRADVLKAYKSILKEQFNELGSAPITDNHKLEAEKWLNV
jgi:hypothetical protein